MLAACFIASAGALIISLLHAMDKYSLESITNDFEKRSKAKILNPAEELILRALIAILMNIEASRM